MKALIDATPFNVFDFHIQHDLRAHKRWVFCFLLFFQKLKIFTSITQFWFQSHRKSRKFHLKAMVNFRRHQLNLVVLYSGADSCRKLIENMMLQWAFASKHCSVSELISFFVTVITATVYSSCFFN